MLSPLLCSPPLPRLSCWPTPFIPKALIIPNIHISAFGYRDVHTYDTIYLLQLYEGGIILVIPSESFRSWESEGQSVTSLGHRGNWCTAKIWTQAAWLRIQCCFPVPQPPSPGLSWPGPVHLSLLPTLWKASLSSGPSVSFSSVAVLLPSD